MRDISGNSFFFVFSEELLSPGSGILVDAISRVGVKVRSRREDGRITVSRLLITVSEQSCTLSTFTAMGAESQLSIARSGLR